MAARVYQIGPAKSGDTQFTSYHITDNNIVFKDYDAVKVAVESILRLNDFPDDIPDMQQLFATWPDDVSDVTIVVGKPDELAVAYQWADIVLRNGEMGVRAWHIGY